MLAFASMTHARKAWPLFGCRRQPRVDSFVVWASPKRGRAAVDAVADRLVDARKKVAPYESRAQRARLSTWRRLEKIKKRCARARQPSAQRPNERPRGGTPR